MAQHNSTTPLSERDSWATPQYLFNWLDAIFNFDVDLAAHESNAKCKSFYTECNNGLGQNWSLHHDVGFCNPPYSDIKPWIRKAIHEMQYGFTTAMLIPTPNGESYYKDVFDFASDIIFIQGRIGFIGADGNPKSGNTRGSCVVVFTPYATYGNPRASCVDRDDLISKHS